MPDAAFLTERQEKWFAAVRAGIERDTGRTLDAWVDLARACPETAHRKRLTWMKAEHGLGQNRAAIVLNVAFPSDVGWSEPAALADLLWADPAARAIYEAVQSKIMRLQRVVVGQRKGFTAYSRNFQFCALRPVRSGAVLGLAIEPGTAPHLQRAARHPWAGRLLSALPLSSVTAIPDALEAWLQTAWEKS
jgi:hypothetical protein